MSWREHGNAPSHLIDIMLPVYESEGVYSDGWFMQDRIAQHYRVLDELEATVMRIS
jgi:hypothetical protein